MPKLPKTVAKKAQKAEATTGGFEPLPAGKYLARLRGVKSSVSQNFPDHVVRWSAEFGDLHDLEGNNYPGRQWLNLSVIQDEEMPASYTKGEKSWGQYVNISHGTLKGFFEGMGFTTDSDTDEMVGEVALLKISVRTIQNGPRKGEKTNQVDAVLPLPDGYEKILDSTGEGAAEDGDDGEF